MAPLNTHTYYEGGMLKVGQRIEVLDNHGKWLESFIVDESETQVSNPYEICYYNLEYDYIFISLRLKFIIRIITQNSMSGLIVHAKNGFDLLAA